MKLLLKAITRYLLGLIIVFLLLFVPANSLNYTNGWLFIILLFIPMLVVGIILLFKDHKLLEKRLDIKEKEKDQKEVILLSGLMFVLGFSIAGLNYKYSWLNIPKIIIVISSILFIISYILYGIVLKQNSYLSRTIKVEKNQKVIDKGLYSAVRHPMYSITIILFLTIPIILNSPISLLIFLIYPFIIIKRINNEEKVLEKELKGYKEYKEKVKYKLIPYIW